MNEGRANTRRFAVGYFWWSNIGVRARLSPWLAGFCLACAACQDVVEGVGGHYESGSDGQVTSTDSSDASGSGTASAGGSQSGTTGASTSSGTSSASGTSANSDTGTNAGESTTSGESETTSGTSTQGDAETGTGGSVCVQACDKATEQCGLDATCEVLKLVCDSPENECRAECVLDANCNQIQGLLNEPDGSFGDCLDDCTDQGGD